MNGIFKRLWKPRASGFVLLALLLCAVLSVAQSSKRLVLKDGTYQPTSEWKVEGDRVRYLSSERGEWEEIPNSLIDWKATEAWNAGKTSKTQSDDPELRKFAAEEEAERKELAAQTPEVASGIRLPEQGGVYLLDEYRHEPRLDELVQSGSELNKNTGSNILRATINPVASAKRTFEVKGAKARVRAHVDRPQIFLDIDQDTQQRSVVKPERFRIVRLEEKKDSRVLQKTKIAVYGKVSQSASFVPARAEKFSGDWVRVVPQEPLAPGEYAVVEMLGDEEMNLFVWDFAVDPSAPENPEAWKPDPSKVSPMGTDSSPVLKPWETK